MKQININIFFISIVIKFYIMLCSLKLVCYIIRNDNMIDKSYIIVCYIIRNDNMIDKSHVSVANIYFSLYVEHDIILKLLSPPEFKKGKIKMKL